MAITLLSKTIVFPHPDEADQNGLLAIGGDLGTERLISAYSMGIFPWYDHDSPILWWSPDPRLVLFPDELRVSRSLRQCLRKGIFTVTVNSAFEQVIRSCADAHRRGQAGTWITGEMIRAYTELHQKGYALSAEAWCDGELAGGLYGIKLGSIFFGESMFALRSNASKVAFVTFIEQMRQKGLTVVDCQVTTEHLLSMGAREIPRSAFLALLSRGISSSTSP